MRGRATEVILKGAGGWSIVVFSVNLAKGADKMAEPYFTQK
jgi:hypothetical protein